MNIICTMGEIAVQKTLEPCAIEATDLEPIRQFFVRLGSNGLRREWKAKAKEKQID